jgi:hypothetical protein
VAVTDRSAVIVGEPSLTAATLLKPRAQARSRKVWSAAMSGRADR